MAARTPRRSFAAPFVVTLAAVPACYVQSSPGPSGPPPPPPTTQTAEPEPTEQPPVIVANPPPPQQPASQPSTPPPQQPPVRPDPRPSKPPVQTTDSYWTVYKSHDGSGCMAAIKVECHPKATCNPPPPFKYACPDDVSLDKPLTVVSQDGGATCFVQFEMPKCPPGVACNPPRPKPVTCPKR
jgi:hypothetical protein